MFIDPDLQEHLAYSPTIHNKALVLAEWNLNIATNIDILGNYRFRPGDDASDFSSIAIAFEPEDKDSAVKNYFGATNFDILVNGGLDDNKDPVVFAKGYERINNIYSLEDCVGRFRPRSGINKLLWIDDSGFIPPYDSYIHKRPRYYIGSGDDKFKYWTSYRQDIIETKNEDGTITKTTKVVGLSADAAGAEGYSISDAAPFVVYKNEIPTNKIVVKIQTGTGEGDGTAKTFTSPLTKESDLKDPFYADADNRENMRIPSRWEVQGLFKDVDETYVWKTLVSDDIENTPLVLDETAVGNDGYLELTYGLVVPEQFKDNFKIADTVISQSALPSVSVEGYAYLVQTAANPRGVFYVWNGTDYTSFDAVYAWRVGSEDVLAKNQYVTDMVSPDKFFNSSDQNVYREFQYIKGLRVVVTAMNTPNTPFDLIEMSPRLCVDISDKVSEFSLNKIASDIGNSGLPVGQLLVSNGSISIFDFDQAFNSNNPNSILNLTNDSNQVVFSFSSKNLQIKFYEAILDVNGADFYLPVKSMYSDGFQDSSSNDRMLSIDLRDMFFYFESLIAPQIVINNISSSLAISMLLDSVGFSNYTFKRLPDENDVMIPTFFIAPNTTIAQVLNDIAVSTQSAMFFDEYNNFVVMSKNYMLPSSVDQRGTDLVLVGSETDGGPLPNIIEIANKSADVYNDGKITYFTRYLQRSVTSLAQASQLDEDRIYGYQPVLLWEVAPTENTKSQNDISSQQSAYVLTAIPLGDTLSADVPKVSGDSIVNNIINLGSAVYWMPRYNGYFYANGEVIKFDAVEYNVPGQEQEVVWISSMEEYQKYFAKIPFGGKMYPTGNVRIYAEPVYDESGAMVGIEKHGRGQFGTEILAHEAGISDYWIDPENRRTVFMDGTATFEDTDIPATIIGIAGKDTKYSSKADVRGIISNSLSSNPSQEDAEGKLPDTGSIKSSALTIKGPYFTTEADSPLDYLTYVYRHAQIKDLTKSIDEEGNGLSKPQAFGARMRIVGRKESATDSKQTPDGGSTYYSRKEYEDVYDSLTGKTTTITKEVIFGGASGGISILLDKDKNTGYYFEIIALSEDSTVFSTSSKPVNNVIFYKLKRQYKQTTKKVNGKDVVDKTDTAKDTDRAIPEVLWSGLAPIVVDDGKFTGQSRTMAEEKPSVYDLAIEYASIVDDINATKKTKVFNLYINGSNIATVVDEDALPDIDEVEDDVFANITPTVDPSYMALFVRGSSNVMFENMYAIAKNDGYSIPKTFADGKEITYPKLDANGKEIPVAAAEVDWAIQSSDWSSTIDNNVQFDRYTIPGPIRKTFVTSVGNGLNAAPEYNIWYEEFGTILREAAYFNVRYDKAYPSMYSIVSPTFNDLCGYEISGFNQNPYGAEFMVFNITDAPINLDSTTGNYLRIQGIAFTQESQHDLTVDEFYKTRGNLANPQFDGNSFINQQEYNKYVDIKNSRTTYGIKAFAIEPKYVQTQDAANDLMKSVIGLVSKERKSVGVKMFANPALQLGDIVTINYDADGYSEISDSRFVIYHMSYSKTVDGPETTIYLSEVPNA